MGYSGRNQFIAGLLKDTLECCFIYILADITSSFKPHPHLSSPRLIFFLKDKSGLRSCWEDGLSCGNTLTGSSDLTGRGESSLEAGAQWQSFTEFIWTSTAKRCLREIPSESSKKRREHLQMYINLHFSYFTTFVAGNLSWWSITLLLSDMEQGGLSGNESKARWWPPGCVRLVCCRVHWRRCRIPLKRRGIAERALQFFRRPWGCLWRTVLVLSPLSHGRQVTGWWLCLVLGITWLQRSAHYCADASSQALAGNGRKEINESPRISAQPFLLSFERSC